MSYKEIQKMCHYGNDLANKRWGTIIQNVWDKLNELSEAVNALNAEKVDKCKDCDLKLIAENNTDLQHRLAEIESVLREVRNILLTPEGMDIRDHAKEVISKVNFTFEPAQKSGVVPEKAERCPACHGVGSKLGFERDGESHEIKCSKCHGEGYIIDRLMGKELPCPNCKGTGDDPQDDRENCHKCDGTGEIVKGDTNAKV